MQPEIQLGPSTLKTFGLMFALGFLASGRWSRAGSASSASQWTGPTR